ncbi:MAG: galactose mutarotase [Cyclobacteriaceae bacterium]
MYRIVSIIVVVMFGCTSTTKDQNQKNEPVAPQKILRPIVKEQNWGRVGNERAKLFTITNGHGMIVRVSNYGGVVTEITVPNKNGQFENVVLGYDQLEAYISDKNYFGAIIGRYANRIAQSKFTLREQEYQLSTNENEHHLHGGERGFDKHVWEAEVFHELESAGVRFSRVSLHMEEGYPGNLKVEVTYQVNNRNQLWIEYRATTDSQTVVNLTNHSYFNLSGDPTEEVYEHLLEIRADKFLPVDETLIPTGQLESVDDTPFDFTAAAKIGDKIDERHDQLTRTDGFDHCWIFSNDSDNLKLGAILTHPESGRQMKVFTTEPAVQFYSGNFLSDDIKIRDGIELDQHVGLCLETQHYPDSPNQTNFPSVVLDSGEVYYSKSIYEFGVID